METTEIIALIQLIAISIGVAVLYAIYVVLKEVKDCSSTECQPEREKPRPK